MGLFVSLHLFCLHLVHVDGGAADFRACVPDKGGWEGILLAMLGCNRGREGGWRWKWSRRDGRGRLAGRGYM
jgi:hypothetical protein